MIEDAIHDLTGDAAADHPSDKKPGQRFTLLTVLLLMLLVLAAAAGGWHFWRKAPLSTNTAPPPAPVEPRQHQREDLFLDERKSFMGLYDLFQDEKIPSLVQTARVQGAKGGPDTADLNLGLVSFQLAPEYFTLLKKPFRVTARGLPPPSLPQPKYLLVSSVTDGGAVVLDREGRSRPVARDFMLKHWGGSVSFLYPYKEAERHLNKGMTSPEVMELQRRLNRAGYPVMEDGVFEEQTFREVVRFQRDFSLKADGIVGPRTMALLFQMTDMN